MEALGLLLTVLADTSNKQKRSSYADELARYLVVHASTDDVSSTTHYPSFYDEHSRHTVLHSEYRVGMALHKLNISSQCWQLIFSPWCRRYPLGGFCDRRSWKPSNYQPGEGSNVKKERWYLEKYPRELLGLGFIGPLLYWFISIFIAFLFSPYSYCFLCLCI